RRLCAGSAGEPERKDCRPIPRRGCQSESKRESPETGRRKGGRAVMTEAMRPYIDKLQRTALIVGVIGLVASAAGFAMDQEQFFRSYLMAFVEWAGVAIGSLSLLMLHHMVGGGWGVAIRRLLEAGTRTFPLVILLFIPVALGLNHLYIWSHADVVAKDE